MRIVVQQFGDMLDRRIALHDEHRLAQSLQRLDERIVFAKNHLVVELAVDPSLHDYMRPWDAFVDRVQHLILPVATLTLLTMAAIARYQRSAMLEVLPADYIRTARAKGLSEREIVWRHAFRNALTPMVAILGLLFPALLGGSLFVEKVFSWPGMGLLASEAIGGRDYDLVTATVIIGSVMVVVGNLLADLLHMAIDPRVRE